ncbi:MAG: hypothetical protein ACI9KS_000344 [Sulfitobacter sp.]|jgi:hypothetical protein
MKIPFKKSAANIFRMFVASLPTLGAINGTTGPAAAATTWSQAQVDNTAESYVEFILANMDSENMDSEYVPLALCRLAELDEGQAGAAERSLRSADRTVRVDYSTCDLSGSARIWNI